MLPPKAVLREKLHELYAQLASGDDVDEGGHEEGTLDGVEKQAVPRKRTRGVRPKREGRRS
jgi:hypothetical protein